MPFVAPLCTSKKTTNILSSLLKLAKGGNIHKVIMLKFIEEK